MLVSVLCLLLCGVVVRANDHRLDSEVPSVQFLYSDISVGENVTMLEVPVVRSGNLDAYLSVSCTAKAVTITAGVVFWRRTPSSESIVVFRPGERSKNCVVPVTNDDSPEAQKVFALILDDAKSSSGTVPIIGPNRVVNVTIVLVKDTPTIELERISYMVSRPHSRDHLATVVVSVLRRGDVNQTSTVRISTRDGLAAAGVDYHPKSTLVTFEPGEIEHLFEVEVEHSDDHHEWHKSFKVVLSADDLVNAVLGTISAATVTILEDTFSGSAIFPAPPVVVSLVFYDDVESGLLMNPSPGYPLICVTSCSPMFPGYASMARLCNESGVDAFHVSYSWEVAPTAVVSGTVVPFRQLTDSVLFARTDSAVLDSIFFKSGYLVRCAVQPVFENQRRGAPVKSKPVMIGSDSAICPTAVLAADLSAGFQSQTFVATLKYLGFHEKVHPNRLHIHVEIPHHDGMLPLISTFPLHNLQLLLVDPIYRKEHMCSNLILPNETEGILGDGFLKNFDLQLNLSQSAATSAFPYLFDPKLRGQETVLLYRHLNLKKCVWTFDAWYHMTELVDLCGGNVLSDSQVQHNARSYTTVRVPLYVSYVMTSLSPTTRWTSLEHHTEMEFSFTYNAALWQTGFEVDRSLGAQVEVLRILLSSSGQLIIYFQTKTKFRGKFILQHPTVTSYRSQLIPPSHLVLTFNLSLLWTAKTYDGPTQSWRAVSDYSLKDYTGKYILELVPCTVSPSQVYVMSKDLTAAQSACAAHPPERFEIPIAFQQTNRPVPELYTLNTHFQLINNERMFLSNPKSTTFSWSDSDYSGPFSKGMKVYGRVLWHPEQDLKSAYKLRIEKVYLCTGQNGYIPAYDPTGDDYGEGPQYGCIQPNSRLKHRILILDRDSSYESYNQHHSATIVNAVFAEDEPSYEILQEMPGVDGFAFDVDGLYNIDPGHQWYVQVLYTIGSSDIAKLRWRRSLSFYGADLSVKDQSKQNGTNMRLLHLNSYDVQSYGSTQERLTPIAIIATLSVILCLAIVTTSILYRHFSRSDFCHKGDDANKYSAERCLFKKQDESVKVLSLGGSQGFVVKVQKVPLACFNMPVDATEV